MNLTKTYTPKKNQKSQYGDMEHDQSLQGNTLQLTYNQALILPRDWRAVCPKTRSSTSYLRVINLDFKQRATFFVVSENECDGTYTLPAQRPDNFWACTTNFNQHQLTISNLSPGAASIEVMLMDTPGEY